MEEEDDDDDSEFPSNESDLARSGIDGSDLGTGASISGGNDTGVCSGAGIHAEDHDEDDALVTGVG